MIARAFLCAVLLCQTLMAQEIFSDRIKGLRVHGSAQAGLPVARLQDRPITVEFDVTETTPPDLHIRVRHCDRDWNVTSTSFINDDMKNKSKAPLRFEPAPQGVQFYRYHYSVQIPGIAGLENLSQSGNYLFDIMDEQWNTVLARGRFFAVETTLSPSMQINNRSLPSEINPYNQVIKIEVGIALPEPDTLRVETLYRTNLKVVDIIRNRQMLSGQRIDADIRSQNTFVDGFGTNKMKFRVDNVQPGNGYRRLDVRNVTDYPEGRQLQSRAGKDLSRHLMPPKRDNFGASSLTSDSRYADYVPYRFELGSETRQYDSVFVVGEFNDWKPSIASLMTYDEGTHRYVWHTFLRRGAYDYQYVAGSNDWISLEGNDWRTISVYSAFVYYHDDRFGGFDRIIGFVQRLSPGGDEPTTE